MIPISKTPIREINGTIVGWLEVDKEGNQQLRDFHGRILGKYDAKLNCTRDFFGRKIAKGNIVISLLPRK